MKEYCNNLYQTTLNFLKILRKTLEYVVILSITQYLTIW